MIEFSLVGGEPLKRPFACAICRGNSTQLLDTHHELPGVGNVYLCTDCVRLAAKEFGWVRGKRMVDLTHLTNEVKERDTQVRDLTDRLYTAEVESARRGNEVERLKAELEQAQLRVDQLEKRFLEQARDVYALINQGAEETE